MLVRTVEDDSNLNMMAQLPSCLSVLKKTKRAGIIHQTTWIHFSDDHFWEQRYLRKYFVFGKAEEHLALFEVTKCGNVTYEPVFSILLTVLLGFCCCFEAAQA